MCRYIFISFFFCLFKRFCYMREKVNFKKIQFNKIVDKEEEIEDKNSSDEERKPKTSVNSLQLQLTKKNKELENTNEPDVDLQDIILERSVSKPNNIKEINQISAHKTKINNHSKFNRPDPIIIKKLQKSNIRNDLQEMQKKAQSHFDSTITLIENEKTEIVPHLVPKQIINSIKVETPRLLKSTRRKLKKKLNNYPKELPPNIQVNNTYPNNLRLEIKNIPIANENKKIDKESKPIKFFSMPIITEEEETTTLKETILELNKHVNKDFDYRIHNDIVTKPSIFTIERELNSSDTYSNIQNIYFQIENSIHRKIHKDENINNNKINKGNQKPISSIKSECISQNYSNGKDKTFSLSCYNNL